MEWRLRWIVGHGAWASGVGAWGAIWADLHFRVLFGFVRRTALVMGGRGGGGREGGRGSRRGAGGVSFM